MNDVHRVSFYWLMAINLVTVVVYGADKLCARMNWWRVPEKILLLLAVIGGSVGAIAAMALFRHKTQHLKFRCGVPVILILQILALLYLHL